MVDHHDESRGQGGAVVLCLVGPAGSGIRAVASALAKDAGFARPFGALVDLLPKENEPRSVSENRPPSPPAPAANLGGIERIIASGYHVSVLADPHACRALSVQCRDSGLSSLSVFVDCPWVLSMRRVCAQVLDDLRDGGNDRTIQIAAFHAERLARRRFHEERWRHGFYDLRFPRCRNERELYGITCEIRHAMSVDCSRHPAPRGELGAVAGSQHLPGIGESAVRPESDDFAAFRAAAATAIEDFANSSPSHDDNALSRLCAIVSDAMDTAASSRKRIHSIAVKTQFTL